MSGARHRRKGDRIERNLVARHLDRRQERTELPEFRQFPHSLAGMFSTTFISSKKNRRAFSARQ
jgi:hypothetical protein